jgi:hypothetical protein
MFLHLARCDGRTAEEKRQREDATQIRMCAALPGKGCTRDIEKVAPKPFPRGPSAAALVLVDDHASHPKAT